MEGNLRRRCRWPAVGLAVCKAMNPSDMGQLLRAAAGALFAQGALHGELFRLDWSEEKSRLFRMLLSLLAGTVFMLCSLLSLGTLVMVLCWDTPHRIPVQITLTLIYCSGMLIAWYRFHKLAALGGQAFADSLAELGTDITLIRNTLGDNNAQ